MVFSSLLFLFRFLPAVLILYYIAPRKLRNVILLLFSLFFYAWGEPKYVFLMLFTITMDFFIGKGIDKAKREDNQKKAKRFLMTSILVDLSILGFFKYADFLIGTVNTLTGAGIPLLGIPLPIGISFFTFQTMSYTIDVYKGSTGGSKKLDQVWHLCFHVSAADRRTDRAVQNDRQSRWSTERKILPIFQKVFIVL